MYCSKCYDERKYTRLELATWQDKIPIIVGIEEILNFMTDTDEEENKKPPVTKEITKDWNENHRYCLCEKESHNNKINNSHANVAQSEPLDLSRSSSTPTNEIVDAPTPRRSIVSNSNYSERELISAVRAICCGRIGTRRAAALYGIPRSTLRNRIFKVYDAKKIHEGDETMSMVDFFKKILKDDSMFSSVFQKYQRESKDEKRRTMIHDKEINGRNSSNRTKDNHVSNKELFKNGLNEVMKHQQHNDPNADSDLNNEEFSLDQFNFAANIPDIYSGFFPQTNHFQTLMSSYLYMMCQQNILSSVYGAMTAPDWQLPDFNIGNQSNSNNALGGKYEPDLKPLNNKETIVKVEKNSLRDQSPSVHELETQMIPDLLNGLVQSPSQDNGFMEQTPEESQDDPKTSFDSTPKIKSDFNIAVLSDETSESSRHKKRGHYRQYNTDMLNKAIEAVRSGEMSVHKAGNHYGVPHSTLEYRVKQVSDCLQDENVSTKRYNKKKRTNSTETDKQNDTESKKTDSDGCNTTSSSMKSQL